MELHKMAVKFFVERPDWVNPVELIPVFHRWIQEHRVPGTLIDVADYSHLAQGPGVGLVGFEADYFLDSMEGPMGFLYSRKAPLAGDFKERVRAVFREAGDAAMKLEAESELKGRLRFKRGESLFIANDRLVAPNTDAAFEELRADLEKAFARPRLEIQREVLDPRHRLAVRLRATPPDMGFLNQ